MELNEVIVQRRTQDSVLKFLTLVLELRMMRVMQVLRCMPQLLASSGMLDLLANICR
jgi:hypothetical protein